MAESGKKPTDYDLILTGDLGVLLSTVSSGQGRVFPASATPSVSNELQKRRRQVRKIGGNMFSEYVGIFYQFFKAFLVGGLICMLAQVVINYTDLTAGKILVLFMLSGIVLQGLGLYQYLVDFAGAGATVPISGFGYLLANGAIKGAQKGFFGAITGAFSAASAGISAAIIFSFVVALIFRSRSKKN